MNRSIDGNNPSWQVLIDNIPVNFTASKDNADNLQRENWTGDHVNGVYETNAFYATYSDSSSRISVYSKNTALAGATQWKVMAVDQLGHTQETGARNLFTSTNTFPFGVLSITGVSNVNLNSFNLTAAQKRYHTSSLAPTFFGIAPIGSSVTLTLIDLNCASSSNNANCTTTYNTIANGESRFGINIPKGVIQPQKSYIVSLSAKYKDTYTVLPAFVFNYGTNTTTSLSPTVIPNQNTNGVTILPTLLTFIISQANALLAQ